MFLKHARWAGRILTHAPGASWPGQITPFDLLGHLGMWKWDEVTPRFSAEKESSPSAVGCVRTCPDPQSARSVMRLLSPPSLPPGLRGAIPYALSLHLDLEPMEKRQLIGTTTIIIVLFTILLLGGSTMPLIRLMDIEDAKARRRNKKDVNLSKTEKMVSATGAGGGGRAGSPPQPGSGEMRHDLRISTPTHTCTPAASLRRGLNWSSRPGEATEAVEGERGPTPGSPSTTLRKVLKSCPLPPHHVY